LPELGRVRPLVLSLDHPVNLPSTGRSLSIVGVHRRWAGSDSAVDLMRHGYSPKATRYASLVSGASKRDDFNCYDGYTVTGLWALARCSPPMPWHVPSPACARALCPQLAWECFDPRVSGVDALPAGSTAGDDSTGSLPLIVLSSNRTQGIDHRRSVLITR